VRGVIIAALMAAAGSGAAPPAAFEFDPKPRWAEDPETDVVCEAMRAECAAMMKAGEVNVDWKFAALYDADGMLVGLRSLGSTGCKPLDEHLVLDQRHFLTVFTKPGQPDLDDITAELAAGTPKDAVRIVKRDSMSVSIGCS
jgi:hypothetical protein